MSTSKLISCRNCGNISRMEIVGTVDDLETEIDHEHGPMGEYGTFYSVLKCPAR